MSRDNGLLLLVWYHVVGVERQGGIVVWQETD